MKLGVYDLEILRSLTENARMPLSAIAKKMKRSPNFVKYRIKILKEKEILMPSFVNVHFPALGLKEFIVYLEVRNRAKKASSVFQFLSEHPFSSWVGKCVGKFNYRVKFVAKNESHMSEIIDGLYESLKHSLKSVECVEILEYILGVNRIITGTRDISQKKKFSETNTHINTDDSTALQYIMENPDSSLLDFSKKLRITPQGARLRLKRLEKSVIRGYSVSINNFSMERLHCICRIRMRALSTIYPKIVSFIDENKVIGRSFSTFGDTNIELTLHPSSLRALYNIVNLLNDTFSEYIEFFENFIILEKKASVPKGIFDAGFLKHGNT